MSKQIMEKLFDIIDKGLQTNTILEKLYRKEKVQEFKRPVIQNSSSFILLV